MTARARNALDAMTGMVAAWCGALGKETVAGSASLVCFRGCNRQTGARRDVCALLVYARYSPVMQFFARCVIRQTHDAEGVQELLPDELPFTVSIEIGKSRMSDAHSSVRCCTSDEICTEFVELAMEVELVELVWSIPTERALLDHQVIAVRPPFVAPITDSTHASHIR